TLCLCESIAAQSAWRGASSGMMRLRVSLVWTRQYGRASMDAPAFIPLPVRAGSSAALLDKSANKSAPTPALPRKRKPARHRPPGHQALGVGSDVHDNLASDPLEEIGLAVGRDNCKSADILPGSSV